MRKFYNRHFLRIELALPFLLVGSVFLLGRIFDFDFVNYAPNRGPLYSTLTAVLGALLGFVITGVSVILAFSESGRLEFLKRSPHFGQVYDIYISAAKWLAAGTIGSFLALILDTRTSPKTYVAYAVLTLLTASILRLYRCIWVLENVVTIIMTDKDSNG